MQTERPLGSLDIAYRPVANDKITTSGSAVKVSLDYLFSHLRELCSAD